MLEYHGLEEIHSGLAFVSNMANVSAVGTAEGLVLIDTGSFITGKLIATQISEWSAEPVQTAIFTHGHVDHATGIRAYERRRTVHVVAHEAIASRFDRYQITAAYNGLINTRQFRVPQLRWPTKYRYPDQTYRHNLQLEIGGVPFELYHDRGETDDHTWIWLPTHNTLCTGDLFTWAVPNCGNPQKVQRYPKEWARALDRMVEFGAETLLPGHGPPIFGADRVRQALTDTAALLHTIHDQTLELMNAGARLDDILQSVELPGDLLERPYLRPVYDDPLFIVRNIWRYYGGWYDGNPARLKPPPDSVLAGEVARLAGGAAALAQRALDLAEHGDLALGCQLAEWAYSVEPNDSSVRAARTSIYQRRALEEPALMARNIYSEAANDSAT